MLDSLRRRCYTDTPIESDVPASKRAGGCNSAVPWSRFPLCARAFSASSALAAAAGIRVGPQSIPLLLPLLLTQPGRNHDPRPSLHPRSNVPAPPPAADATRDDPSAHDVYKCFCYSEEYKVSSQ